jgi:hypothetical protein
MKKSPILILFLLIASVGFSQVILNELRFANDYTWIN